jgi:hypothetical protein
MIKNEINRSKKSFSPFHLYLVKNLPKTLFFTSTSATIAEASTGDHSTNGLRKRGKHLIFFFSMD